jgi:glycine hydroxymethyltransferase
MAVYAAVLEPGDTILSLRLDHGGHLTHGHKVNFSGRLYTIAGYGVSRETMMVDYDEVLAQAKEVRPKLIVCGGSAYPRTVESDRFREIADEVGALLLCDMAHFAGLVAAGLQPNPVEHCDFVTSTTPCRAARGLHPLPCGACSGRRPWFPGVGGPLEHNDAAKATCFKIAMTDGFREYQQQIRANADTLAETPQIGGPNRDGRHRHTSDADRSPQLGGRARPPKSGCEVSITVNRNTVPFDERPPTVASGSVSERRR